MARDFKNSVVVKPWGKEWRCYESETVTAWMLEIKAGHSTSLHSHPGKLTGYIVIDGEIELQFLNSRHCHKALDKAVIHPFVPHRTFAVTDCKVIEVECPKDHGNLVRFEDDYGREGKPYEAEDRYVPRDGKTPHLAQGTDLALDGGVVMGLRQISPGRAYSAWLDALNDRAAVAVMSGELVDGKGVGAVVPGHVIWGKDLKRLAGMLELREEMEVLVAWQDRS